jgi:ketosteroid isomerase-like protein
MSQALTPSDVFRKLAEGVASGRWEDLPQLYAEETHVEHPLDPLKGPPLCTREELRRHFKPEHSEPDLQMKPANVVIHETSDPEVIVAECEYCGTVPGGVETFALPCIFVIRVRDGVIVRSRDYVDHIGLARVLGQLDELVVAIKQIDGDD